MSGVPVGLGNPLDMVPPDDLGCAVDRVVADAVMLVGVLVLVDFAGGEVPFTCGGAWCGSLTDQVHDMVGLFEAYDSCADAEVVAELLVNADKRGVERCPFGEYRVGVDEACRQAHDLPVGILDGFLGSPDPVVRW